MRDAIQRGRLVQRQIEWGQIARFSAGANLSKNVYNMLRLSVPFLRRLATITGASRVLFFERDSVVCASSPLTLHNFSRFDYIGAPWPLELAFWCVARNVSASHCCCNSGLSIVNIPPLLRLLARYPPSSSQLQHNDMYFVNNKELLMSRRKWTKFASTSPRVFTTPHY